MLANIIIMVLILGYCAFVIYKSVKNSKEGKHMGCAGCSGNCGSCGRCSGAAKGAGRAAKKAHRLAVSRGAKRQKPGGYLHELNGQYAGPGERGDALGP